MTGKQSNVSVVKHCFVVSKQDRPDRKFPGLHFHTERFWGDRLYAIGPLSVVSCLSVLSVTLVYRGNRVGWIKIKLRLQIGLGRGHIVLDRDQLPLPNKGHGRGPTICGPRRLWPNGWMDQDGTWQGGWPRSTPHCAI